MIPELRARGIGETLDTAVSLYRAHFLRLMAISALAVIPLQALTVIVLLSAEPDRVSFTINGSTSAEYNANPLLQLAASLVVLFLGFVSSAFVIGLCARLLGDTYVGNRAGGSILGGRSVVAVLGLCTLVALFDVAGFFLCGIGAFVAMTFVAVALPVLILEGTSPTRAFGRSWGLTSHHFFRVLGVVAAGYALASLLSFAFSAALAAWIVSSGNTDATVLARGAATAVASLLTAPYIAATLVVCYFDLRIRDEGFDVELMMQRNDARHARARAAATATTP